MVARYELSYCNDSRHIALWRTSSNLAGAMSEDEQIRCNSGFGMRDICSHDALETFLVVRHGGQKVICASAKGLPGVAMR